MKMLVIKTARFIGLLALLVLCGGSARAQRVRGELRLEVHDPHGAAGSPAGEMVSETNGGRGAVVAGVGGGYGAQGLPFGVYRLSLLGGGFAPGSGLG